MQWDILDLGTLAYAPTLERQRQRNRAVSLGEAPPALLLVEHPPVITVTHRKDARQHLLASPKRLAELGIDVQGTDRGGDITYHGPGQLVAYPILRLSDHGLNLGRYMRLLEEAVIDTLAAFGVTGQAEPGATGVWVKKPGQASAKICAMGVRIRKNTTLHGLAINVTTNLSHFETIDPCGLGGRPVTSLAALLGEDCPSMPQVKKKLTACLATALDASTAAKPAPAPAPAPAPGVDPGVDPEVGSGGDSGVGPASDSGAASGSDSGASGGVG